MVKPLSMSVDPNHVVITPICICHASPGSTVCCPHHVCICSGRGILSRSWYFPVRKIYWINKSPFNGCIIQVKPDQPFMHKTCSGYSSPKTTLILNGYIFIWNEDIQNCFSARCRQQLYGTYCTFFRILVIWHCFNVLGENTFFYKSGFNS